MRIFTLLFLLTPRVGGFELTVSFFYQFIVISALHTWRHKFNRTECLPSHGKDISGRTVTVLRDNAIISKINVASGNNRAFENLVSDSVTEMYGCHKKEVLGI